MTCPTDLRHEAVKRMIELRNKHGITSKFEIKWSKVSPSKIAFYLDLIDYFFDDDDLQFRTVVAAKQGLDHADFNQTHDDWYYKMMFYLIRNVVSVEGRSNIYLDRKDTRGGVKVGKLHEVIANSRYDFDRKKIQRLQIVESHHVNLLQLADLLIGAVNYANRGLSSSQAKVQLMNRVKERSGLSLTKTTVLNEKKFNIFMWQPRGEVIV